MRAYLAIITVSVMITVLFAYLRITSDLEVCRVYYPKMNAFSCWLSDKTIAVPRSQP